MRISQWLGRHRRGLTRTLTAVTATLALGVGGIALAGPAAASSILGMCDADEHLPLVEVPDTSTTGASFGIETLDGMTVATMGAAADGGTPDYLDPTHPVVTSGKTVPTSAASQVAGSGLAWHRFSADCRDALSGSTMTTWVGNTLLNALVVTPVRWLGVFLKFAFGTGIVDLLLAATGPLTKHLTDNVFASYWPVMILFGGLAWIGMLLRSRGRQAATSFGWAVLVIGLMSGTLFTTSGAKAATALNDWASQATMCATFSAMGVDCGATGGATVEGNVVETLATGTWGVGALGELATQPIPEKVHVTKSTDVPHFDRDLDVTIPVSAIPHMGDQPTWGDALRWTQTLTASEKAAITQNPDRACKATVAPTTQEITSSTPPAGLGVCGDKWLVRAAILSTLHETNPAAYAQVIGQGDTITPALNGVAVLIAALGIAAVGGILFFYQLKLLMSFVSTPIVALASIWKFQVVKKWADLILGTIIHRLIWGVIMGIILWGTGEINALMTKIAVTWGLSGLMIPVATGIATVAVLIAGFAAWPTLKGVFSDAVPAAGVVATTEKVGGGAKQAGVAAVGAVAGGVGASAVGGSVMAGAARGALGSTRGGLGRVVRATGLLSRGGGQGAGPGTGTGAGAGVGSSALSEAEAQREAQEAQTSLAATPEAKTAAEQVRAHAGPRIQAAEARAASARADLAAFDESPDERERVAGRAAAFLAVGNDPATAAEGARKESEARQALVAEIDEAQSALDAAQADAGFVEEKWAAEARQRIIDALSAEAAGGGRGSAAETVATQLGVHSPAGVAALRQMEQAERRETRLRYHGVKLAGD